MQKEVWAMPELEDLAVQYGATGIIGKNSRLRTLPNYREAEIISQSDIETLAQHKSKLQYVVVSCPDWKAIPSENIISLFQGSGTKILVKTNDYQNSKMLAFALEVGVDGFVVSDPNSLKYFCKGYDPSLDLKLVEATVTEVKHHGLGKRACIDSIMSYSPREGLVVGFLTGAMVLADGETQENPYVNTREWRVNAGAASLYTLTRLEDGTISSKLLDDLRTGDEVIAVDSDGKTRTAVVGRVKKEWRPMTYIKARYEDRIIATASQTAETVRLVTKDGSKPVTDIEKGDELKVCLSEQVATHLGRRVKERIVEV